MSAQSSDGFGGIPITPASKGGGEGKEIRPSGKTNAIDFGSSKLGGNPDRTGGKGDQAWYQKGAGLKYTTL